MAFGLAIVTVLALCIYLAQSVKLELPKVKITEWDELMLVAFQFVVILFILFIGLGIPTAILYKIYESIGL